MGKTLSKLSQKKICRKSVFPNRFCIEICEQVHTHYRNLRITSSIHDWVKLAEGFRDALERWQKRGRPTTGVGKHIELCRKEIISEFESEDLLINLNENLYKKNEGKIFAEGANLTDDKYIHLKIRDLRLELTLDEFKELIHAVREAANLVENSCLSDNVQAT